MKTKTEAKTEAETEAKTEAETEAKTDFEGEKDAERIVRADFPDGRKQVYEGASTTVRRGPALRNCSPISQPASF